MSASSPAMAIWTYWPAEGRRRKVGPRTDACPARPLSCRGAPPPPGTTSASVPCTESRFPKRSTAHRRSRASACRALGKRKRTCWASPRAPTTLLPLMAPPSCSSRSASDTARPVVSDVEQRPACESRSCRPPPMVPSRASPVCLARSLRRHAARRSNSRAVPPWPRAGSPA
jgi:hypothetical protein